MSHFFCNVYILYTCIYIYRERERERWISYYLTLSLALTAFPEVIISLESLYFCFLRLLGSKLLLEVI